jgi:hypothetical protein
VAERRIEEPDAGSDQLRFHRSWLVGRVQHNDAQAGVKPLGPKPSPDEKRKARMILQPAIRVD